MPTTITNVRLQVESIKCLAVRDGNDRAEPYIWPVFFRVDDDLVGDVARYLVKIVNNEVPFVPPAIVSNASRQKAELLVGLLEANSGDPWCVGTNGAPGNLGAGVAAGETRNVPLGVGRVNMNFRQHTLNDKGIYEGRLGLCVVVLEEDTQFVASDQDIEDRYRPEYVSKVEGSLWNTVFQNMLGFEKPLHEQYFDALGMSSTVYDTMIAAGVNLQLLYDYIIGSAGLEEASEDELKDLFATIELTRRVRAGFNSLWTNDDFVGAQVRTWPSTVIENGDPQPFEFTVDSSKGKYKVTCRLTFP